MAGIGLLFNKFFTKIPKMRERRSEIYLLGLAEVNHKDENKHNNHVDNLEWISRRDNLYYGTRLDRIKSSKDTMSNDGICNSYMDRLRSVIVECKNAGMSREDVEEMMGRGLDDVFGER